jgi:hypothetical protein
MAKRRMFSMDVVDTDAFLDMPPTTQNLYFHLGMRADDDGFVSSPKKIMKIINCGEDDMKILLTKNFIIGFESGVVVIKHWRLHNYISKDRYNETNYKDEKGSLKLKENKVYTECIQNVDTGKVRLGKVSQDKVSINIPFSNFWDLYSKKKDRHKCELKWEKLSEEEREQIIKHVPDYVSSTPDVMYRKNPLTYLNGKCWEDEVINNNKVITIRE